MKTFMKLVAAVTVAALVGMGTLGCNTMKSAGRDIQKGGRSVENAATGAQGK